MFRLCCTMHVRLVAQGSWMICEGDSMNPSYRRSKSTNRRIKFSNGRWLIASLNAELTIGASWNSWNSSRRRGLNRARNLSHSNLILLQELYDMASHPREEHSYILDSFEEFEALARRALHEGEHGYKAGAVWRSTRMSTIGVAFKGWWDGLHVLHMATVKCNWQKCTMYLNGIALLLCTYMVLHFL